MAAKTTVLLGLGNNRIRVVLQNDNSECEGIFGKGMAEERKG